MNIGYLYIVLIIIGILVGLALAWFMVELILTIRKARLKVDEIHEQLTPTLKNIEEISEKVQPTLEKIDPLMERVTLTVDAANLELMRADQILENVNVVSEGVANATTAVGNIASAPSNFANKAADKIVGLFGGSSIIDETVGQLGDGEDEIERLGNHTKNRKIKRKRVRRRGNSDLDIE